MSNEHDTCKWEVTIIGWMWDDYYIAKQTQGFQAAWNAPPPAYFDIMGGTAMPAPPMYYNMPANYYGWAPPAYNFPPPEGKKNVKFEQEKKEDDTSSSGVTTIMKRFKKN